MYRLCAVWDSSVNSSGGPYFSFISYILLTICEQFKEYKSYNLAGMLRVASLLI